MHKIVFKNYVTIIIILKAELPTFPLPAKDPLLGDEIASHLTSPVTVRYVAVRFAFFFFAWALQVGWRGFQFVLRSPSYIFTNSRSFAPAAVMLIKIPKNGALEK